MAADNVRKLTLARNKVYDMLEIASMNGSGNTCHFAPQGDSKYRNVLTVRIPNEDETFPFVFYSKAANPNAWFTEPAMNDVHKAIREFVELSSQAVNWEEFEIDWESKEWKPAPPLNKPKRVNASTSEELRKASQEIDAKEAMDGIYRYLQAAQKLCARDTHGYAICNEVCRQIDQFYFQSN